jgi:hypothetical protein
LIKIKSRDAVIQISFNGQHCGAPSMKAGRLC